MIAVVGEFANPTSGSLEGKPCGWAVWPSGSGFEWEAFAAESWRRGSSFYQHAAIRNAQKALNLLKQVKA